LHLLPLLPAPSLSLVLTSAFSLFKDMADLVATQGTILDRIDHNISSAISYTKQANEDLTAVRFLPAFFFFFCLCRLRFFSFATVFCFQIVCFFFAAVRSRENAYYFFSRPRFFRSLFDFFFFS
jgi:hypothetical protein